ncbi:HypA protein [Colletotrichum plurivorum]|uniref:HypA protein n=1 Tax=Colletotrichum plurivorum TaxID=2175906 RepID=A0A8H6NGJ2_9PEZI|nr:HypA protein [Colletotrichum plurivorum]
MHPLIHTGFGLEFDLPFLVCEGLAMACTQNDDEVATAMLEIEGRASRREDRSSLAEILDACAADEELIDSLREDPFHIFDSEGLFGTSKAKLVEYASRYTVLETEVELRSAELCNATSYLLVGAQRLGKEPRADFFLLHATNCSILVDFIVQKDWIGRQGKTRLLSWFGRISIMMHIAMGCPKLDLTVVRTYKPRKMSGGWADVIDRSLNYADDGHGCKIIRPHPCSRRKSSVRESARVSDETGGFRERSCDGRGHLATQQ